MYASGSDLAQNDESRVDDLTSSELREGLERLCC